MKALITDIKHFAVHDGPGIRTTVFFKGCPLHCLWCHNPEGLSPKSELAFFGHLCTLCGSCAAVCPLHEVDREDHAIIRENCTRCGRCVEVCPQNALKIYGKYVTPEALLPQLTADRGFYENSGGGITLSGGECLLQADVCRELLRLCKEAGLHTAVDTCGHVPRESIEAVRPFTDLFLYDIKAEGGELHRRLTGVDNGLIWENLCRLDEVGAACEIRIPLVPGCNDGEIPGIARRLAALRHLTGVRVLPYHDLAGSKYAALGKRNTLPARVPTEAEIEKAEEILTAAGCRILH